MDPAIPSPNPGQSIQPWAILNSVKSIIIHFLCFSDVSNPLPYNCFLLDLSCENILGLPVVFKFPSWMSPGILCLSLITSRMSCHFQFLLTKKVPAFSAHSHTHPECFLLVNCNHVGQCKRPKKL